MASWGIKKILLDEDLFEGIMAQQVGMFILALGAASYILFRFFPALIPLVSKIKLG
jgi:hypothetical protein